MEHKDRDVTEHPLPRADTGHSQCVLYVEGENLHPLGRYVQCVCGVGGLLVSTQSSVHNEVPAKK